MNKRKFAAIAIATSFIALAHSASAQGTRSPMSTDQKWARDYQVLLNDLRKSMQKHVSQPRSAEPTMGSATTEANQLIRLAQSHVEDFQFAQKAAMSIEQRRMASRMISALKELADSMHDRLRLLNADSTSTDAVANALLGALSGKTQAIAERGKAAWRELNTELNEQED